MIWLWFSVACGIASVGLWKGAFSFAVDAAPIGSIMMAASIGFFLISLVLLGIALGSTALS